MMAPANPPVFLESDSFSGEYANKNFQYCDTDNFRVLKIPFINFEEQKMLECFREQVKIFKLVEEKAKGT